MFKMYFFCRGDMDEKIASFHLKVRDYDKSHPNNINFNSIDYPAMDTVPFPTGHVINEVHKETFSNMRKADILGLCKTNTDLQNVGKLMLGDLLQADMNPGRECIVNHILAQFNYQPVDVAGGSYKALMGDYVKNLADNCNDSHEATTIAFHDDDPDNVKHFINLFNESMESQLNQSVPTSLFSFKIYYVEVKDGNYAKVIREPSKKNSRKAGTHIKEYTNTLLPAKISFTIYQKHFHIIFPWVRKHEELLLSITGKTHDIYKGLFSKLKGVAVGFEYSKDLKSLNDFLSDNYLFINKNGPLVIKGADLSVLLILTGITNVPYNVSALAYHFLGIYHIQSFVEAKSHGSGFLLFLKNTSKIIWKIAVICQILFTMQIAPTPGMAWLIFKRRPVPCLTWISMFFNDILDGAELPCTADYVGQPRRMLSFLSYSKVKYWSSDILLLFLPEWRGVTGGGSLTDKQCLQFMLRYVPVLTSKSVHKSLRIADPWDIGVALGYNFNDPVVFNPKNYSSVGIIYDELCNELHNGKELEGQIIQLVRNGDEELIGRDIMPQLKQSMLENQSAKDLSPSNVFLMLCWRHFKLAEYYFHFYHHQMDSVDFYLGRNFFHLSANHIKKPSQVLMWENKNLESSRALRILKCQKMLKNPTTDVLGKKNARRDLRKACKQIGISVDQATKYAWKKIKDARNNSSDAKADPLLDRELDFCEFTDEGEMVDTTESWAEEDCSTNDTNNSSAGGDTDTDFFNSDAHNVITGGVPSEVRENYIFIKSEKITNIKVEDIKEEIEYKKDPLSICS